MQSERPEPSKVTKVLVHKIHGGRKKDSRFWNIENDLSDEELVSINPENNKPRQDDYKRSRKNSNTVFSVLWRFLLVCLILDGSIYCYFHFIRKTTVSEGIAQIRKSIYGDEEEVAKISANSKISPVIINLPATVNNTAPPSSFTDKSSVNQSSPAKLSHTTNDKDYLSRSSAGNSKFVDNPNRSSSGTDKIYSWKDSNGNLNFSNTGFPNSKDITPVSIKNMGQK
jgi:hypothetical protein